MAAPDGLVIRDPRPEDEAVWRRLWAGYVDFYEAHVSEDVTAATWRRQLNPNSDFFGRLAERDGAVCGFTVSVLHPGVMEADAGLLLGGSLRRSVRQRTRHRPCVDRRSCGLGPRARLVAALLAYAGHGGCTTITPRRTTSCATGCSSPDTTSPDIKRGAGSNASAPLEGQTVRKVRPDARRGLS
jgi:hypothetical protein